MNISKNTKWRAKIIIIAIISYLFSFFYTETSSYPKYKSPDHLDESLSHYGVIEEKRRRKWSAEPYRMKTKNGPIYWGCDPNDRFADYCPEKSTFDSVVGRHVKVYLLPTKDSKYHNYIILSMKINGKEIVKFNERKIQINSSYSKNDEYIRKITSIIVSAIIVIVFMSINRNFSISSKE